MVSYGGDRKPKEMGPERASGLRHPAAPWVAYVVTLLCAAAIRLLGLFGHSTIPDEAFTFFIAAHPVAGIVELLKTGDFHPPLVYLIGHALFAISTRAYLFRLVSVLFGIAGVAATYAVARRIVPGWAALAMLLAALNPALVFFDGFFRMYAMLWSLCALSWGLLLWALDEPARARRWVAYGACLVALLYTQYIAFFTVAAQAVFVLCAHRRERGFWWALAGTAVAFLPWLPVFFVQYPLGGSAYTALRGHWSEMLMLPALVLVDGLPLRLETSVVVLAALWALVLGGVAVAVARRQWLALWFSAPLALQVAYSLVSGKLLFGQRYLLQAVPALVVLEVLALFWLARSKARIAALALTAGLVALTLAGTVDKHFLPQYMPVDWTAYRRFLEAHVKGGDAVVFDGSMTYYVLIGSDAVRDRPVYLVASQSSAREAALATAHLARVWLVEYQPQLPDPQRVVFNSLLRSHATHQGWTSTTSGYGDVVVTTLFAGLPRVAGPKSSTRTTSSVKARG